MDDVLTTTREREFDYRHDDFERARTLIRARAGISLSDAKRNMVYNRLARRVRSLSLDSIGAYLDLVESGREDESAFVNALTTNLTAFFRESHHFAMLAERMRERNRRPLRVWCAAASTGEEPWSIAMTLRHEAGSGSPGEILATDIDTAVLERARAGVYDLDRAASIPAEFRSMILRGTGENVGRVRIGDDLRALVRFGVLNLTASTWSLGGRFDVVFCRNVLIYFDRPTQRAILERIRRVIADDGLLFTGHSESLFHAGDLFVPIGKTGYRCA